MKKYLLSLEKDSQRRQLFFSQPDTETFEIFSAINTMSSDWEELAKYFDLDKFQKRYARKVTKGEIGCTLSHLAIYQKIAEDTVIKNDDYCLICEDDALFCQNAEKIIQRLAKEIENNDIVLVGQSKINSFNDKELEINYPTTFSFLRNKIKIAKNMVSYAYPYKSYFAGTVAYLIKKTTAQKIVNSINNDITPFWLADDFIFLEDNFQIKSLVVRPLVAIENPCLMSNLENTRGSKSHHILQKMIKYPLKKILAIKRNLWK